MRVFPRTVIKILAKAVDEAVEILLFEVDKIIVGDIAFSNAAILIGNEMLGAVFSLNRNAIDRLGTAKAALTEGVPAVSTIDAMSVSELLNKVGKLCPIS